jgi:hypothetical protein
MARNMTLTLLLLCGLLLLGYQGSTLLAAPPQQTTTATPAPTEEPLEEAEAADTESETVTVAAEPTLAALAARVNALQAQVDALAAATLRTGLANEVTTAVYLLDNAGLHGLDVRLNSEGVIEPSDAGRVARVARLLSSVDWPPALAEDAAALTDTLSQLASALREDNLDTAAPLAIIAHEDQHAFSHDAEHWLSGLTSDHGDEDAHDEENGDDHGDEDEENSENSGD